MQSSNWKWHLDEVFVKINGERYYLRRAVVHEGEVQERYVTKKRDKKAALKFMKKLWVRMDRPMRSSQIGFDPTVQQQNSWALQISKLHSDGQTSERRIYIYRFDDENARCYDLGVCTASKSSHQSTPHFTITSIHKGHFQNAIRSS